MLHSCTNCGSKDVVTIQGQEFCINCGHEVKAAPKVAVVAALTPKAAPQPTAIKPKPEPIVVNPAKPTPAVPVKTPQVVNRPKPIIKKKDKPEVAKPEPIRQKAIGVPGAFDIAPRAKRKPPTPAVDLKPHAARFTAKVAWITATPVGFAVAGMLWLGVDNDIFIYVCLSALMLVATIATLAQSALLYGLSRAHDGRAVGRKQWWRAARSGLMDTINVNLMTLIVVVVTVALGVAVWKIGDQLSSQLPAMVLPVALSLTNAVLLWVLLGALAARHIALPAVIIGALDATTAYRYGWRVYRKAGGHLIITLGETWIARLSLLLVLVALAIVASHYLKMLDPAMINMAVVLGSGVGVALVIVASFTLMFELEAKLWLKQYRHWVEVYLASQRLRLLSGRLLAARR